MEELFTIQDLRHLKHHLTTREQQQLSRYGGWAWRLSQGLLEPRTPRQEHFVAVCRGEAVPETDFECLWLRYRQLIDADHRIDEQSVRLARLEDDLARVKREAHQMRKALFEEKERSGTLVTQSPRPASVRQKPEIDFPEQWREQP